MNKCDQCGKPFYRRPDGWDECKTCHYVQTPEDAPSIMISWQCTNCRKVQLSTQNCICPHCGGGLVIR